MSWRERRNQWRRFDRWTAPESARERASRLRWLEEAIRLSPPLDEPVDHPETRIRRRRIREALARIRA